MSFPTSQRGVIGDFCEHYVGGLMDLQFRLEKKWHWQTFCFLLKFGCERERPRMVARGRKELNCLFVLFLKGGWLSSWGRLRLAACKKEKDLWRNHGCEKTGSHRCQSTNGIGIIVDYRTAEIAHLLPLSSKSSTASHGPYKDLSVPSLSQTLISPPRWFKCTWSLSSTALQSWREGGRWVK